MCSQSQLEREDVRLRGGEGKRAWGLGWSGCGIGIEAYRCGFGAFGV